MIRYKQRVPDAEYLDFGGYLIPLRGIETLEDIKKRSYVTEKQISSLREFGFRFYGREVVDSEIYYVNDFMLDPIMSVSNIRTRVSFIVELAKHLQGCMPNFVRDTQNDHYLIENSKVLNNGESMFVKRGQCDVYTKLIKSEEGFIISERFLMFHWLALALFNESSLTDFISLISSYSSAEVKEMVKKTSIDYRTLCLGTWSYLRSMSYIAPGGRYNILNLEKVYYLDGVSYTMNENGYKLVNCLTPIFQNWWIFSRDGVIGTDASCVSEKIEFRHKVGNVVYLFYFELCNRIATVFRPSCAHKLAINVNHMLKHDRDNIVMFDGYDKEVYLEEKKKREVAQEKRRITRFIEDPQREIYNEIESAIRNFFEDRDVTLLNFGTTYKSVRELVDKYSYSCKLLEAKKYAFGYYKNLYSYYDFLNEYKNYLETEIDNVYVVGCGEFSEAYVFLSDVFSDKNVFFIDPDINISSLGDRSHITVLRDKIDENFLFLKRSVLFCDVFDEQTGYRNIESMELNLKLLEKVGFGMCKFYPPWQNNIEGATRLNFKCSKLRYGIYSRFGGLEARVWYKEDSLKTIDWSIDEVDRRFAFINQYCKYHDKGCIDCYGTEQILRKAIVVPSRVLEALGSSLEMIKENLIDELRSNMTSCNCVHRSINVYLKTCVRCVLLMLQQYPLDVYANLQYHDNFAIFSNLKGIGMNFDSNYIKSLVKENHDVIKDEAGYDNEKLGLGYYVETEVREIRVSPHEFGSWFPDNDIIEVEDW